MSKIFIALGVLGAATGTIATRLIWSLLTDPASMVTALGSGSVKVLLAALFGTH